jgi:hypothetical protein
MKPKIVVARTWLSALEWTRRRQFLFRNNRLPVRTGEAPCDKWLAVGAATMPFSHAAFHRAKIRLIRHQWRHGRYPAEYQSKHRRRRLQSGEDSFSYVLFHNAAILVSNDGRSIHFEGEL